jgi:hypothetical protein
MNALNRAVIVVLLVIAMVLCSVLLVGAKWVLPPVTQQLSVLAESIEGREWYEVTLPGGTLACVVDVVLFLFIVLQVRRPRKSIRVEKAAGGEVLVSIASISDRLKYEVDQLPEILRTRPDLSGKRSGVVVELDVEAAAGVNVPEKAGVIVETARRVIEDDMGLKLVRPPKVNLRVVSYPKGQSYPVRSREARPAEPAPEREAPLAEPAEWLPVEPEVDLFAPSPDDEPGT